MRSEFLRGRKDTLMRELRLLAFQLRQVGHDTHDSAAYQADGDGGDEDHDDLVDDGHGVPADHRDDAVGVPHGGEKNQQIEHEGDGDHGDDHDLAIGVPSCSLYGLL